MIRPAAANRIDTILARPKRALWTMALPMMTGFAAHSLYLVGDMAFIGRLGPSALAGAQFVGALFFTVMSLNIGFSTGVTAIIAQAVGRRDTEGAAHTASSAMGFGLIIGIALAILGFLTAPYLVPLLGAEGESLTKGLQYFEILTIGISIMFFSGAIRAVLTGEGDAKTPMTVVLISTAINTILDPILMFVLDWGITGAAVATVVSQFFSLSAYCYVAFVKRRSYVTFIWSPKRFKPDPKVIAPVLKIGFPTALGQVAISFGGIFYNRVVAAFGQTAVAGYGAASKVDLLVMLPIIALAAAQLSLVGMFAGAGRWDAVRASILYAFRVVMSITLALCAAAYFLSFRIVGVFTEHPHALEVGHIYLRYMVAAYPLAAVGVLSGRILQGLGQGIPPLIITVTRVLLIGIPGAYAAVYLFDAGIESIWIAMISGGAAAAVAAILWIRYYVWKHPDCKASSSIPPDIAMEG